jgi:hypothetical protein
MTIQDRIDTARKKIEDGRKQCEEGEQELIFLRQTACNTFKTQDEFRQWLKRHQLPESEAQHWRKVR